MAVAVEAATGRADGAAVDAGEEQVEEEAMVLVEEEGEVTGAKAVRTATRLART